MIKQNWPPSLDGEEPDEFGDDDWGDGEETDAIGEKTARSETPLTDDAFGAYLRDIRGLGLLTHAEEGELAQRVAAGDQFARRRLIECNLRLVISIARRYARSGVPLADLVQEGNLGLMRAVQKFDSQRGTHFSTYATWWIRQAVSRAVGEHTRMIHLPEHIAIRLRKVRRLGAQLSQEDGVEPLPEHIAAVGNMDVAEVIDLLGITEQPISLDASLDESDPYSLADALQDENAPSPPQVALQNLLSEDLQHAVGQLTPRERDVITLHYGIVDGRCRTLLEIGKELGISRERARQLEVAALGKLRATQGGVHGSHQTPP